MEPKRIKVIGRLQKELHSLFYDGLDLQKMQNNQVILCCDYSEFEFFVNHVFTEVSDIQKGRSVSNCQIVLKSVSQQFFKSFDCIPRGWKTICKFEFLNSQIPDVIYDLPEVQGWDSFDRYLYFENI